MLIVDAINRFLRKKTVLKVFGAVFTQGLLSGTNFVINLSIARYASKADYGKYVILFSILLIFGSYQNALFNSPFLVLHSKKKAGKQTRFLSGLFHGQWLFFSVFFFLALIFAYIYSRWFSVETAFSYTSLLSLFAFPYLFREFIRTIHYSKLSISSLILMDSIFAAVVLLVLFLLIYIFQYIDCSIVIILMSSGYLLSSLYGYLSMKERLNFSFGAIITAFKEIWRYSFWAILGVTYSMLQSRSYIYIVTLYMGIEELANISVARLLLMPVGLLINSSSKIFMSKGADFLERRGIIVLRKFILLMVIFLLVVCLSYSFLLWIGYDLLIKLFGSKYTGIESLVVLWFFYFLIFSVRFSMQNTLLVLKNFKITANFDLIGAVLTVGSCFLLIRPMGAAGGILSLIIGETAVLLLSLYIVRNLLFTEPQERLKA